MSAPGPDPIPPKTLSLRGAQRTAVPAEPSLIVVEGLEPGRRFGLDRPETRIGRAPDNDVVLSSPAVSAEHARVIARDGQFFVEDLDSTNGVVVNSARLRPGQPHPLANGDAITVSDHVLLFHHAGAQQATAATAIAIDRDAVAREAEELLRELPRPRG